MKTLKWVIILLDLTSYFWILFSLGGGGGRGIDGWKENATTCRRGLGGRNKHLAREHGLQVQIMNILHSPFLSVLPHLHFRNCSTTIHCDVCQRYFCLNCSVVFLSIYFRNVKKRNPILSKQKIMYIGWGVSN